LSNSKKIIVFFFISIIISTLHYCLLYENIDIRFYSSTIRHLIGLVFFLVSWALGYYLFKTYPSWIILIWIVSYAIIFALNGLVLFLRATDLILIPNYFKKVVFGIRELFISPVPIVVLYLLNRSTITKSVKSNI
jgi:hypothetical protein